MEKIDDDTKNILIGALIGGVLGVCTASLFLGSKNQEKESESALSALGKVVVHIGEMLHSQDVKQTPFLKDVEKKVHKHENTISHVLEMISSGIHLWEKIKKG